MKLPIVRKGWVGRLLALLAVPLLLTACSTSAPAVAAAVPAPPLSEDDDLSDLIGQLSTDLSRSNARQVPRNPVLASGATRPAPAAPDAKRQHELEFAARAKEIFGRIESGGLQMPVVGVEPVELVNSWGNARDGGRRKHRGIDIFAPRGTAVVAVADGVVSFIGEQRKAGRCIWLTADDGRSYFYAHLDRWAAGLYEGLQVRSGDLLGYVGNTGNAKRTSSHLHFAMRQDDETINPYPALTRASLVRQARVATDTSVALGTR